MNTVVDFKQGIARQYKKSNTLVNAKGSCSLLCYKVLAAGLMNASLDAENRVVAEVPVDQMRDLFGVTGNSVYDNIKSIITDSDRATLLDWRVITVDDKNKQVGAANLVTEAYYSSGLLRIVFNQCWKDYIIDLSKN